MAIVLAVLLTVLILACVICWYFTGVAVQVSHDCMRCTDLREGRVDRLAERVRQLEAQLATKEA